MRTFILAVQDYLRARRMFTRVRVVGGPHDGGSLPVPQITDRDAHGLLVVVDGGLYIVSRPAHHPPVLAYVRPYNPGARRVTT